MTWGDPPERADSLNVMATSHTNNLEEEGNIGYLSAHVIAIEDTAKIKAEMTHDTTRGRIVASTCVLQLYRESFL